MVNRLNKYKDYTSKKPKLNSQKIRQILNCSKYTDYLSTNEIFHLSEEIAEKYHE